MRLSGATVSPIAPLKGKEYAFTVTGKSKGKKIYLAGHSIEEAEIWHGIISKMADVGNKDPYLRLKKLEAVKMTQSTLGLNKNQEGDSDEVRLVFSIA